MSQPFEMDSVTVTNAPAPFPSKFQCQNGVQLLADDANTGKIFVGNSNLTTTAKSFPLKAGASIFVPVEMIASLYVVGDVASGKLWYFAT